MSREEPTDRSTGLTETLAARIGGTADEEEGLFDVEPKWYKVGFYLFLLGWLGYMLWQAMGFRNYMDWLFPLILGVPGTILILIQLAIVVKPELVDRFLPESEGGTDSMFEAIESASERTKAEREKYELLMIGWIALLPFMMFYIGMGWTLVIYTFGFVYYFTGSAKTSVKVTVVVIVFTWVLFIEILELIIWDGWLEIPGPLRIIADFRRGNL